MKDTHPNVPDSSQGQAETVVGPSVKIQGDLNSEGGIRVEGQVTGKIKTTQNFYAAQGARIVADISAGNAVIGGEVQGNIKVSGQLILESSGRVTGDIACSVLRVEDGAVFTGKCSMNGNGKTAAPSAAAE